MIMINQTKITTEEIFKIIIRDKEYYCSLGFIMYFIFFIMFIYTITLNFLVNLLIKLRCTD